MICEARYLQPTELGRNGNIVFSNCPSYARMSTCVLHCVLPALALPCWTQLQRPVPGHVKEAHVYSERAYLSKRVELSHFCRGRRVQQRSPNMGLCCLACPLGLGALGGGRRCGGGGAKLTAPPGKLCLLSWREGWELQMAGSARGASGETGSEREQRQPLLRGRLHGQTSLHGGLENRHYQIAHLPALARSSNPLPKTYGGSQVQT